MKRKITSLVLAVVMILSLAPCVMARTVAEGNCGDSAIWTLDNKGTLTISGTGIVYSSEFYQNDGIKRVVVEEGITELRSYFRYDENLIQVVLPSSLKTLSLGLFYGCTSLKKISVPAGVETIGVSDRLQLFVEEFAVDAANTEYKSVNGVIFTKGGDALVAYPPAKSAVSYAVPDGVVWIYGSAFSNAGKLRTVSLPASAQDAEGAFYKCDNLENIYVAKNNEYLTSVDGVLYSKDMTVLYRRPAKNKSGTALSGTVNKICSYAFEGSDITEFDGGDHVLSMDIGAFENCKSLTSFSADGPITCIEQCCFKQCVNLKQVKLPDTVETIGREAFYNCYELQDIKLPSKLETIGEYAFMRCNEISEIRFPHSLRKIDYSAFENCYELRDIYYEGTKRGLEALLSGEYWLESKIQQRHITLHFVPKPSISGDVTYADGVVTVPITATELDCILAAAAYRENALVGIKSKTLAKEAEIDTISINAEEADRIAVYIWDSLNGLAPMCESSSLTVE